MPNILHLTDLHLGDKTTTSDISTSVVANKDFSTRDAFLIDQMNHLSEYLHQQKMHLDAIVISGDIADKCSEDGFNLLEKFLAPLKQQLSKQENIVLLPGNHDVNRNFRVGDRKRYELFLSISRERKYITPFIDDIDNIDAFQEGGVAGENFIAGEGWKLLPINSSHFCSASYYQNAKEEKLIKKILKGDKKDLKSIIKRCIDYDISKITENQLGVIGKAFKKSDPNELRIVALHHQLAPVSTREEFKAFEVITNCGLLKKILHDNRVDLVLHGHKHSSCIYLESGNIEERGTDGNGSMLVISGVSPRNGGPTILGRILCVEAGPAKRVAIKDIHSKDMHMAITLKTSTEIALWDRNPKIVSEFVNDCAVSGDSIDDVYERLLALFAEGKSDTLRNVMCTVKNAKQYVQMPKSYPSIESINTEAKDEWFKNLVSWWQSDVIALHKSKYFNHGKRIFKYRALAKGEEGENQLEHVIETLTREPGSTRGFITLLDPQIDKGSSALIPSFCSAHFYVMGHHNTEYKLSCNAIYRKQELKYWWPINVGELTLMCRKIINALNGKGKHTYIMGDITTFAFSAHIGKKVPKIAIPLLDQKLEENREQFWANIYELCITGAEINPNLRIFWDEAIESLRIPATRNEEGTIVPYDSLAFIVEHLQLFASKNAAIASFLKPLNNVLESYASFDSKLVLGQLELNKYDSIFKEITRNLNDAKIKLATLLAAPHSSQF